MPCEFRVLRVGGHEIKNNTSIGKITNQLQLLEKEIKTVNGY